MAPEMFTSDLIHISTVTNREKSKVVIIAYTWSLDAISASDYFVKGDRNDTESSQKTGSIC